MPRVEGSELLELPRADVWRLLNDPAALGPAIPGCRGFERIPDSDHRYKTAITVAVGAVTGIYEGTVEYLGVDEPERCTIVVSGRGDKGAIDGSGAITLEARDGRTKVGYRGDFKVTGPVAGLGQRLAPGISRRIIVETLRNLERRGIEEQAPAQPAGAASRPAEAASRPAEAASQPAEAAVPTKAFRPLSLSPVAAFAAGCAIGLAIGVLIGLGL